MIVRAVIGSTVSDERDPRNPAPRPRTPAERAPAPTPEMRAALARLPKIDVVLARDDVGALDLPRWALVQAVRDLVAGMRQRILAGQVSAGPGEDLAARDIEARARELAAPSLCPVINATGVIVHTNLGRAPLSEVALRHVVEVAGGYANLEYDLDAGRRGSRHGHVTAALTALTGAEDAVVVNNNAAAVMLALATLASGREVVVSRGELVEIGGSFRIPDVMRLSGAILVEVGTTNKTRLRDYESAVGPDTALLLKVHRSNFVMVGFTEEAAAADVAALGARAGVPTMMDLGSGFLLAPAELQAMGLPPEPGVGALIAAGVDVVSFSGDKLLGGPQAGVLCGRAEPIARMRAHPLMRALRPDKMTLAALEATLAGYRDRGGQLPDVPVVAMLAEPAASVRRRAEQALARVIDAITRACAGNAAIDVSLAPCASTAGGGAMPGLSIPSWGLALTPIPGSHVSARDLEARLRRGRPPVIGCIAADRLMLDMRTVQARETDALIAAVISAALPPPEAAP